MKVNRTALPFVILLGTIFGSTLVISRFSVGQFDPRVYISFRMILAALLHLGVYLFSADRVLPRRRILWIHAVVLGVIGTALPMTSIVSSLQYLSSGMTSMLLTLNPVVTVILAQFVLADERLTGFKVAGVIVAFSGAGLLLLQGETGLSTFAQADWRGYAWALTGILAGATGAVYARRFLRYEDAFDVASIRMFSAGVAVTGATTLTVGFDLSEVVLSGWVALVWAGVVGTFLGFLLNFFIIKRFGATANSQTSYVVPVASTVLGAIFLGERVTLTMITGMLIIFTGLTLLNWAAVRSWLAAREKAAAPRM